MHRTLRNVDEVLPVVVGLVVMLLLSLPGCGRGSSAGDKVDLATAIAVLQSSRDANALREAAITLAAMEDKAAPAADVLLELLSDREALLERLDGQTTTLDDLTQYMGRAVRAIGPDIAEAVVARIEAGQMVDTEIAVTFHDAAVPRLAKHLAKSERLEVRRAMATMLGVMGHRAVPALPTLLEQAGDDQPMVRAAVLGALGRVAPPWPQVSAAFEHAMADEAAAVRLAAVEAMQQMDPHVEMMPLVIQALSDDDREVRLAGLNITATLPGNLASLRPAVQSLQADPDPEIQQALESVRERVFTDD